MTGQPSSNASKGAKGQRIQSQREVSEEIKPVTHGSPQPFQWKPKIEMRLSKEAL